MLWIYIYWNKSSLRTLGKVVDSISSMTMKNITFILFMDNTCM